MNPSVRGLALATIASATLGGSIGALATAATQSQASPQAIAAAVQSVQDRSAERSLAAMAKQLGTVTKELGAVTPALGVLTQSVNTQGSAVETAVSKASSAQGSDDVDIYSELLQVCRNTLPVGALCPLNFPNPR